MAVINPQTDEQPLDALPEYGGRGGGQQAAEFYAARDFATQFGRNPTRSELSMLSPSYLSGDPNIAGLGTGKAAIAQYYQSLANTPQNQYAKQQADYEAKAPGHYGTVDQLFQGTLGRAATDAEKKHFGSLLASGQVDEYGIGQFVQALPENIEKKDKAFQEGLSNNLQTQDARYFNEELMPGIQSQFANQGRDIRSSGFANALAMAGQNQNRQRESFLSNLSAQQYGGRQDLAQRDYLNTYGNYQGLQDYSRQRAAQLQDATQNRVNELADYDKQARAYSDFLSRYGKRSNAGGIGSLAGGLLGGGIGAMTGTGPAGIQAGYTMGSGVGGGFGSFF